MGEVRARVGLLDAASAAAGSLFCGVAGYAALGATLWAVCSALQAPLAVTTGVELAAGVAMIVGTVYLLRHALKLAANGWA